MRDKDVKRHVFISHAVDDPDWPLEAIEEVGSAIRDSGIGVFLDSWYERAAKYHLSDMEWISWFNDASQKASHILCLISANYLVQMQSRPKASRISGVKLDALQSLGRRLSSIQGNTQSILALRAAGDGYVHLPDSLFGRTVVYEWPIGRSLLLSHLKYEAGPNKSTPTSTTISTEDNASSPEERGANSVADIRNSPIALEAQGIPSLITLRSSVESKLQPDLRPRKDINSLIAANGLWAADAWRAPIGDFPPPWASAWGDDVYGLWADLTVNGVTQRMRWIEPSGPEGFWMGSTQQERDVINDQNVREWANQVEHEPTCVPIKQGFWLADTPCTQAFWQAVTGDNPSHFSKGRDAPERPVESVSWNDVDEQFVQRFAQTPAWGTDDRLCLPSEEEWVYAARAGTRSAYWWGDAWDETRGNADVTGGRRWDDKEGTTPVHRYAPNPWGLYDMHGNVWEWCSSPWRPRRDAPEARPDEDRRVVRGGSWISRPDFARAACRGGWLRWNAPRDQGFRFALRSPAGPETR